jgi:hypothetical protein
MEERRRRRSASTREALRILLETVRDRSDVTSIAVVDSRGLVVSGIGEPRELAILGIVAGPAAGGMLGVTGRRLTDGTDVVSRPFSVDGRPMWLAALGDRVSRMAEATTSAERILKTA